MRIRLVVRLLLLWVLACSSGCGEQPAQAPLPASPGPVVAQSHGASSYTPYDWASMLWAKAKYGTMAWVSSGGEAGNLLVSKAGSSRRPDWCLCSQGVVAGLAARGHQPVIVATVVVSDQAVRPVFRKPRVPLQKARSLFIPKSSIELAFDRLLTRSGVAPEAVRRPSVQSPSFQTIVSLLRKPTSDVDAIDFGILVEPFISNIISEDSANYEVGEAGLYELHYCLVVRREDLRADVRPVKSLLSQLAQVSATVEAIPSDAIFYDSVWGRSKGEIPDRLPKLRTFERPRAKLQLHPARLRQLLREEITYLVSKYPTDLKTPNDIDLLVDEGPLREVAPERVLP